MSLWSAEQCDSWTFFLIVLKERYTCILFIYISYDHLYYIEEAQKDQDLPSNVNEDTIRADEFEELAKICLDKNQ